MKKHLLFAAMLTLSVAPVIATTPATIYYAEGSESTVEEQYQALIKSIKDFKNELTQTKAEIQKDYPNAEDVLRAVEYTISGEGGLDEMLAEVEAKHEAGTLTAEEIATCQQKLETYKTGMADVRKQAKNEEYRAELNLVYQAAKDQISEAEENLPDNVYDYFSSAMDAKGAEIDAYYYDKYGQVESYTATMPSDLEEAIKPMVAAAIAIGGAAPAASDLVTDIKATLPQVREEIEKVRTNFPDYDLETAEESVADWQKLLNELTDYIADDAEPYTKADIEDLAEEFDAFKDENLNLSNVAQKEAWLSDYTVKYWPVYSRISEINSTLYDECPTVCEEYMKKLQAYNDELDEAYQKLSGSAPVTKDEFDAMMARVDEIALEIEKVLEDAKAAEAATGIDHISVDQLGKDAKVYTLDGKRVDNIQIGLYIVNGKKIILK